MVETMGLQGGALAAAVIFGILGCALVVALLLFLFRLWMQGPKVSSTARLDGKTVVITGANTGIGKVTAMELSKRGAKVVMLCRNMEKAEEHKLDLSSLASVRECAEQLGNSLEKIDILINNAGIMACPEMRTQEGFEMQ